uniref:3-hydroxyacyl-[acyl-carrier-protein] dehydratase FabZ n=1 Tax=Candidatus Kentrum sp. FM TaxID=2126340 RepID=A0A450VQN1_9GAMM|nr:MAG: 3-hydroxyacyl-[acyl-carrier-protein] dehydratase/UDP-3-O-[3-hydroxymyristoyl] N-acetylglucosamine deacetylase / 3-hydroxyacyl-[acyl-carrier-protein] dehydratase [Candidatus Kentron sp. FM]VFJ46026.1 MAG: 3-hydroxyacyl-[acyl-carrier-protein] dehydratase/UDP-3-O-[3-hydroxymyristoyl] N-acetylglucosamine deacetylase / 3-hydroxyacyl-[acyl-carrier-protein] dehydratase [Candidatus Kentron sp. FM]VFK07065.1 MAG: 3-hydroxyacyl-[acyl-carrier-protein] dehydratase/UDP-3-O-[3-hydroxymyristoyl] N-acety
MIKRKAIFDIEEIKRRLPHRYPFLLVDRILESTETKVVGIKNVTINEPYFDGHFPGESIMPGTLIAESMAQTAAFIGGPSSDEENDEPPRRVFLSGLQLQFKQPVVPGDILHITVEVIRTMGAMARCRGTCRVEGELVARGEFSLARVPENR